MIVNFMRFDENISNFNYLNLLVILIAFGASSFPFNINSTFVILSCTTGNLILSLVSLYLIVAYSSNVYMSIMSFLLIVLSHIASGVYLSNIKVFSGFYALIGAIALLKYYIQEMPISSIISLSICTGLTHYKNDLHIYVAAAFIFIINFYNTSFFAAVTLACAVLFNLSKFNYLRINSSTKNTIILLIASFFFMESVSYLHLKSDTVFTPRFTSSLQHQFTPKGSNIIIGAGPTGLGAATRYMETGTDFIILEKANTVGGLAASRKDENGFTWDFGGHVLFSHFQYFDEVVDHALKQDQLFHERQAWVWMKNRFIPYPFQNNIWRLDKNDQDVIVNDIVKAQRKHFNNKPANFEEWLRRSFGDGLCDIFMIPYNRKVWAHPAKLMSSTWVGERVAKVNVSKIEEGIMKKEDAVSWGPNNMFLYPKYKGIGDIFSRISNRIFDQALKLNSTVVSINPVNREITVEDNHYRKKCSYSSIINTMSLQELVPLIEHPDTPKYIKLVNSLLYSTTHVIGIGIRGAVPSSFIKKCWYYFPEDKYPFYRVTVLSNYSPDMAPEGCWSLMVEVAESKFSTVNSSKIVDQVIDGLLEAGFIQKSSIIVSRFYWINKYGYPTPSVDRDEILDQVQPWLESLGILSRGRFGGWKYEVGNMDHSFMQGVEAADAIMSGTSETVYFRPDFVNSQKNRRPFTYLLKSLSDVNVEPGNLHKIETGIAGPRRQPYMKKRGLVGIPIGSNAMKSGILNNLIEKFGFENFDFIFFAYDKTDWSTESWFDKVVIVHTTRTGKWWFPKRFVTPQIMEGYDYFFYWDDDIDVTYFDPIRFLDWMDENFIDIGQPCVNGYTYWDALKCSTPDEKNSTVSNGSSTKLETAHVNFIEVMVPVYSRKAYIDLVYPNLQWDLTGGWGYDHLFSDNTTASINQAVNLKQSINHLDLKSSANNASRFSHWEKMNNELNVLLERTSSRLIMPERIK